MWIGNITGPWAFAKSTKYSHFIFELMYHCFLQSGKEVARISYVAGHPVQKLKDNLDKYPRTFDSFFLSYMIDTYIKTLK